MSSPSTRDAKLPSLSSLHWAARSRPPAQFSVELAASLSWTVSRVWTTASVLESTRANEAMTRVVVGVSGKADVSVEGIRHTLSPGQVLLAEGAASVITEHEGIWARCEWHLSRSSLKRALPSSRPIGLRPETFALITNTTNVISTRPSFGSLAGSEMLHAALAAIVLAGVQGSGRVVGAPSASSEVLLQMALSEVEHRHRDPEFSVVDLARSMHLSERQMRRLFAGVDATPSETIERQRLATADAAMLLTGATDADAYSAVAAQSGFRSARHLRLALRRRDQRSRQ